MADLADFEGLRTAQNDGREFPIVGPLREVTGITVLVAGPDSDRLRTVRHRILDRRLHRQRVTIRERALMREEEDNELLASAIIDWRGIVKDGQPFLYSPENAEWLVARYPVFRDQIDVFSSSRALFAVDAEPADGEGATA